MQNLVHLTSPQQPRQVSSSESEGQLAWGPHSGAGPAVSMTSRLLPDWLVVSGGRGALGREKGRAESGPALLSPWGTYNSEGEGLTAAENISHLDRTQMAKVHPRKSR